jgi:hypothetical protein
MKWVQGESSAKAVDLPPEWEAIAQLGASPEVFGWKVVGWSPDLKLSVEALGLEGSLERAMGAAVSAYERLRYALCTDSPEDMPHALSSLLEAAETLVDVKDHGLKPHIVAQAARDNFESSCEFARRVLRRVPKMGPP